MATYITPPITGYWNLRHLPEAVQVDGTIFRKAVFKQPYDGVVEQYREDVVKNSRHLKVFADGTWHIDHVDDDNPDRGRPIQHFFNDHPLGGLTAVAALVFGSAVVIRAVTRG